MEKVCEPGISEDMKHRQIVVAGLNSVGKVGKSPE